MIMVYVAVWIVGKLVSSLWGASFIIAAQLAFQAVISKQVLAWIWIL